MSGRLGCGFYLDVNDAVLSGTIVSFSDLGAERQAVDNIHDGNVDGWGERFLSCIAMLKPVRITIVDVQGLALFTKVKAAAAECTLRLPPQAGYSTGEGFSFPGGVTDFQTGGGTNERVMTTITVTPTGKPTPIAAVAV